MRTLGSSNKLNHFFGATEPVVQLTCIRAQRFCCELRGKLRIRECGILGHEADLINANSRARVRAEVLLQTFCQGACFRPRFHERAHEIRKFFALYLWGEANARDAGCGEQVGEAALGASGFERLTI